MPFKPSSNLIDSARPSSDDIAGTTTETAFATTVDLPLSRIVAGKRARLVAKLKGTSSAATPPTVVLALKGGAITLATRTLTFAADQTDVPIQVVSDIYVQDVGVAEDEEEEIDAEDGHLVVDMRVSSAGLVAKEHTTVPTVIDMNQTLLDDLELSLTADWSAATAGNSLELLDIYVEQL